jgi:Rho termination factor, N-terminal domain
MPTKTKKVDVSKIDADKVAEDAMDAGDLGEDADIIGTRVESTGDVIVVTSAGVKARVTTDGEVQHLVGPQAAPDIYEPPEFTPGAEDIAAGAEDLPPLEPIASPDALASGFVVDETGAVKAVGDVSDGADMKLRYDADARRDELEGLKVPELKALAEALGIDDRSKLKKDELVDAIVEAEQAEADVPPFAPEPPEAPELADS